MGDYVLLRSQKARLKSTKGKTWLFPKMNMRYCGPFCVIDKINDVAFVGVAGSLDNSQLLSCESPQNFSRRDRCKSSGDPAEFKWKEGAFW